MIASKPKILYIGPHKENSNEGEISRGDLVELHMLAHKGKDNINLATRSLGHNNYKDPTWPYQIPDYDDMSLEGVSHVIQYSYPERWERYGNYRHIGYLDVTNDDISKEYFVDNIRMMDEIWSPTAYGCRLIEKVCDTPVSLVPHAVDLDLYEKDYKISEIPEVLGTFRFFHASNNMKSMKKIIESFFQEFDPTEPVSLIIKSQHQLSELIKSIKQNLNLYKVDAYSKIILVDSNLSFFQTMGLCQYSDCYIDGSELSPVTITQNIPTRHTIGFNKPIIGFDNLGKIQSDMRYVYEQKGKVVHTISKNYLFGGEFGKKVMVELI